MKFNLVSQNNIKIAVQFDKEFVHEDTQNSLVVAKQLAWILQGNKKNVKKKKKLQILNYNVLCFPVEALA